MEWPQAWTRWRRASSIAAPTCVSLQAPSAFSWRLDYRPAISRLDDQRGSTRLSLYARSKAKTGSDPRVPRIAALGIDGTEALPEFADVIGDSDVVEVFQALIPELTRDAQTQRSAEGHRQFAVVHAQGHERVRMHGLRHVDALPSPLFDTVVDDILRLGQDAGFIQHRGKRSADPFGDVRPAFFARDFGDLAVHRHALQIGEGQDQGARHGAVDDQTPVFETACLQLLEVLGRRLYLIGEWLFGNHAAREVVRWQTGREQALACVGEGFPRPRPSTAVGRNQSVAFCDTICRSQPAKACSSSGAAEDQLASRECVHSASFDLREVPRIMAPILLRKPDRLTIGMWTRRNRSNRQETRK